MKSFNFVCCPSYHGATLLSCLLNNHSQITAPGDTVPIAKYLDHALCGCGRLIAECPFWAEIEDRLNPERIYRDGTLFPSYPILLLNETINKVLGQALGFLALNGVESVWRRVGTQAKEFVNTYERFYQLACTLQGTSCFVDGQKNLVKITVFIAMKLRNAIRVLHLVRDPRGVYYSYMRRQRQVDAQLFAKRWKRSHGRIARLARQLPAGNYYRLRYEDLCTEPETHLDSVQDLLGLERETLLIPSCVAATKHTIGNQMLGSFNGRLTPDVRWQTEVSRNIQRIILKEAFPFSAEMGYATGESCDSFAF